MRKLFKIVSVDMRRAIFSWRFTILLVIGLMLLYQPVFYLKKVADGYRNMELIDAIMCASGLGYYTSALALLSGLVYSDSFAWEYMGGVFPYIVHREGRKQYIVSKLITTALSSGGLVCICFIIFCVLQVLLFVPRMPSSTEMILVLREAALLMRYGMTWSLVGLAVSVIVPNPMLSMTAPFCMAQCLWLLSAVFNVPILNVNDSVFVLNGTGLTAPMIFVQEFGIAGISTIVFSVGIWKRSHGK